MDKFTEGISQDLNLVGPKIEIIEVKDTFS